MFYFITGNQNKIKEAKNIQQLDIDLSEIQEINPVAIVKEKLKTAFKNKKGEFIVEDTSLYFDCLNGLPDPLIKWFLKALGQNGLYKLTFQNKKAEARTIISYAKNKK